MLNSGIEVDTQFKLRKMGSDTIFPRQRKLIGAVVAMGLPSRVFLIAFALLAGCGSDFMSSSMGANRQDSGIFVAASWSDEFAVSYELGSLRFRLPLGGEFKPLPDGRIHPGGTVGAVSFGRRAQGSELADARVSVVIRKFRNVSDGSKSLAQHFAMRDKRTQQSVNRRLESAGEYKQDSRVWIYRRYSDIGTAMPWGEEYALDMENGWYVSVESVFWPSYAKDPRNVEQIQSLTREVLQHFKYSTK